MPRRVNNQIENAHAYKVQYVQDMIPINKPINPKPKLPHHQPTHHHTMATLYVNETLIFGITRNATEPPPLANEILVEPIFSSANRAT